MNEEKTMQTAEELLARIAELEAENSMLKQQKRRKPEIFTEQLKRNYPWVEKMKYRANAETNLGKLVRAVCFPVVKKPHMHHYREGDTKEINYNYVISLSEMNNDQLRLYNEVVEKIVKILSEYQTILREDD